jgi:hypothetical protein
MRARPGREMQHAGERHTAAVNGHRWRGRWPPGVRRGIGHQGIRRHHERSKIEPAGTM